MNPVSRYTSFGAMLAGGRPTKSALSSGTPLYVPELVELVRSCVAIVVLIFSATTALAQPTKQPNPADPDAAVSALKYESAFSDYQPFREQKSNSWKQVNKEVADNPGMGAMNSMKDMSGKSMPGMDSKTAEEPMKRKNADEMAMAKPDSAPGQVANAQTAGIIGTGIVLGIDKANGKVKLTHDPIAALGWPKMTMFFRLKDSALADQVKEGDKVEFSLEKAASGYVISGFQKGASRHDMKQMKK